MTNPSGHFARLDIGRDDEVLLADSASQPLAEAVSPLAGTRARNGSTQPVAAPILAAPCLAHWLFEQQALRTPTNIALAFASTELSYAELNRAANRFAHKLQHAGLQRGELVGLFVERGPHAIIAILGILKAGAAFLPLDPTYPTDRIRFMLEDAAPRGIVTTAGLRQVLDSHLQFEASAGQSATDAGAVDVSKAVVWEIKLDECIQLDNEYTVDDPLSADPSVDVSPDDLAYAIFTSGSTGRPKAALLAHRGLRNLCTAQQAVFPVNAESRVLQFASLCFDASISEIFVTLTCGATLCLVSEGDLAPSRLTRTLNELRITVATIPPSVLNAMAVEELPRLQTLVTAGEACPLPLVRRFAAKHRLINAYGPTEASVCATMHVCDPRADSPPPIGAANPGCQVVILDENQQECAEGEAGEIYLGGVGLAKGYLNRPELTAERFVEVLLHGQRCRLYKTGDIGRRREDGLFEFVGRRDQQVKIRGVRIELGELEHTLLEHPGVQEAVVTTEEDGGIKRLVAHVAGGGGAGRNGAGGYGTLLTENDVFTWLRSRVMPAMLPSEIHCRHSMPLLPNGKIDRKALHKAAMESACETNGKSRSAKNGPVSSSIEIAPRDRFELVILEAFVDILGADDFALEDDFFVLGGDSLQAMDLLARMESSFGIAPSMAELMQAPNVAGLAQAIARRLESRGSDQPVLEWNPLVRLTPAGAKHPADARPIYFVHPGGGNVLCFLDLAKRLADDRPAIGLMARGLEPGQRPLESVEELAEEYLAAIRQHQPEGPYAIAGWSFGGFVAYEMANRLLQAGEEVEHLGIIDMGLLYSFGVLTTLFPEGDLALFELRRLPPEDQMREFAARTSAAKLVPPGANPELSHRIFDTFMANVDAMMDYRPDQYAGQMTLYRAAEPLIRVRRDLADEWRSCCDNLEVCTVAGNHLTMIHEPNVADLANQMRERLAFR